jgi:hypothetical protein
MYGVDVKKGALAIVRPDQRKIQISIMILEILMHILTLMLDVSMVVGIEDHDEINRFFEGFAEAKS